MKTVVLALALVASSTHMLAQERSAVLSDAAGFSLLPAETCARASDVRRCQVAQPKEWSDDDRLAMQDALRRLTAHELVQGLLVGAQENGYSGLRRYATGTKHDPMFGPVAMFNPGFVLYGSKVIGITDALFQSAEVRDPLSDYRFGDLILVHELAHAFDDLKLSTQPGFTSISGWTFRNNRWEYTNPVGISAYHGVYAETLLLYVRGRYREAWTRDRSFATSLTFPLPTIESLASPGESFADMLAHLILDSGATTYLKPQVVEWFENQIFPLLKDKARRFNAANY